MPVTVTRKLPLDLLVEAWMPPVTLRPAWWVEQKADIIETLIRAKALEAIAVELIGHDSARNLIVRLTFADEFDATMFKLGEQP